MKCQNVIIKLSFDFAKHCVHQARRNRRNKAGIYKENRSNKQREARVTVQ